MSDENPFNKYRELYRDIILGYSVEHIKSEDKRVYIKHLTDVEVGLSEREYKEHIENAVKRGLKKEKDTVNFLIEEGLWSQKNEERITVLKDRIKHLRDSKEKLLIKSQVSEIEKELKPYENELYILNYERGDIIGTTAESFANKKISESTIKDCFFKDRELKEPYYTEEDYDYLPQKQVNESLELYANVIYKKFEADEIKRISVSPFFMNNYYLCDDNAYNFFGKPILELTNFQVILVSYGKNFKSLMTNNKPAPEDYMKHPDKIIEWYEMQSKTAMVDDYGEKGEASGRSYFGASKKEMESIGKEKEGVVDLKDEVVKQGGEMNFDQILKMHGI